MILYSGGALVLWNLSASDIIEWHFPALFHEAGCRNSNAFTSLKPCWWVKITAGYIALDIYESNGHVIVVQLEMLISDNIIISILNIGWIPKRREDTIGAVHCPGSKENKAKNISIFFLAALDNKWVSTCTRCTCTCTLAHVLLLILALTSVNWLPGSRNSWDINGFWLTLRPKDVAAEPCL